MQLTVIITAVLVGLLGIWALWFTIVDRAVILRQLVAGAVVELALLAQVVVGLVAQAQGHRAADPWTFWGYVITALFLLPVAAAWAFADRSRWSSVVLLVACVALLAMQARVWQVWTA
ncbi:hypothetical protein [Georgenia thermotolerans]|uniref:Integral membrane protein n=1 Tax=Georgenia thermotolerans TaxID=527326 RepID=A0A7J5UNU4_9MICO|nr:hypothetical protein [Georgenia thermotolerans]KAE8764055.1 hypothetical protein GB883_11080 [Georgenia thermotolerans]